MGGNRCSGRNNKRNSPKEAAMVYPAQPKLPLMQSYRLKMSKKMAALKQQTAIVLVYDWTKRTAALDTIYIQITCCMQSSDILRHKAPSGNCYTTNRHNQFHNPLHNTLCKVIIRGTKVPSSVIFMKFMLNGCLLCIARQSPFDNSRSSPLPCPLQYYLIFIKTSQLRRNNPISPYMPIPLPRAAILRTQPLDNVPFRALDNVTEVERSPRLYPSSLWRPKLAPLSRWHSSKNG